MSIRNLDSMFDPSSVAAIGASRRPGRTGTVVWQHLLGGDDRLTDNRPTRQFLRSLGFVEAPTAWGNDTVDVTLTL